jgi:membrane protease YdiL (CAAX protease family)
MRFDERILGPSQLESRLPWGPVMAVVLVLAIMAVASSVGWLAERTGLIYQPPATKIVNPDGSFQISIPVPTVAHLHLLQIPLLLLAASRLRVNPLDALALRLPTRLGRTLLIFVALLALEYVLKFAEAVVFAVVISVWELPALTPRSGFGLGTMNILIIAPVLEELIYRGILLQSLVKTRLGFWGAAVLTSLAFAAMHAPYDSVLNVLLRVVPVFFTGMVLALALRQTGSLWVCIALHTTVNGIALTSLSFRA